MSDSAKLAALKEAFDRAFAAPPAPEAEALEAVIVVSVGAGRVALRLAELAGLHPLPAVVPLPGRPPGWLGLAGLRGELVAVADLARALGFGEAGRAPRWLAQVAANPTLALAFDELEGYHHVPRPAIAAAPAERASALVPEFLAIGETVLGLVSLDAVASAMAAPTGPAGP